MKIIFFNHEYPQMDGEGSADTFYWLLREYSKNSELEIDYVCASQDGRYHQLRMGENITIHRLPISEKIIDLENLSNWQMLRFSRRAYKFSLDLSRKNRYDLSHACYAFPGGFASLMLKWRRKIPYVLSLQNVMVSRSSMVSRVIAKVLKKASYASAENANLKKIAEQKFPDKQIEMIPKGINTEDFFPDLSERNDGIFNLLCDTQLVPIKGVRFLIQALKILSSRYSQIRINIVGEGNEKASLQDFARGLELETKIEFLGEPSLDEKLKAYQDADVFVSPSLEQNGDDLVGIRLALASGLAVVTTHTPGVEELVVDESNGFLVAINTADDLAEKIEKLILDESLRLSMGKRSFELATKCSWENVSRQYLDLYSKMKNLEHIND